MSAAYAVRGAPAAPKGRCAMRPSSVREKTAPQRSSSQTSPGASLHRISIASWSPCGYGQAMSDLSARFRAAYSLEQGDPAAMFFTARLLDDGLSEVRSDRWATSERSLAGLGEPLFRSAAPSQDTVVAWWEGALLHVMLQSGYVYAQVASADEETALKALGEIRE